MNNIIDEPENSLGQKSTKYTYWSFRSLIYVVILNIIIFFLTINQSEILGKRFSSTISILEMLNILLIIIGSILCFLAVKDKEEKSNRKIAVMIVYPLIIFFTVLINVV